MSNESQDETQPNLVGTDMASDCWWGDDEISFEFTPMGLSVWHNGFEHRMKPADVIDFAEWLSERAKVVRT